MKITHNIDGKLDKEYSFIENLECQSEKKYKFYLDNILNYIYITDRLIFRRESDEYIFEIEISDKPQSYILLKGENKKFDINVLKSNYIEKDNFLVFSYILETENQLHEMIVEIGD